MALVSLLAAATILAAAPTAATPSDPLAPARAGQLMCLSPDVSRKACRATAKYTWQADGKIREGAETLLGKNPAISMRTSSFGEVRSGTLCGTIDPEELDAAVILIEGRPAPKKTADYVRGQLFSILPNYFGREFCFAIIRSGAGYKTKVSLDGTAWPEASEPMIWVSPTDGYVVKP